MKSLRDALADYPPAMLKAIAEGWGLDDASASTRDELIEQLAAILTQPDTVQATVGQLPDDARAALDAILAQGGKMRAAAFLRDHGAIRSFGPGRLAREKPLLEPASATERLWFLGLVHRGFDRVDEQPTEVLFVPMEIAALLPQAKRPTFAVEQAPKPARMVYEGNRLVEDVFAFLATLQDKPVQLLKSGALPRSFLAALNPRLATRDDLSYPERIPFIHRVAEVAGLVALRTGSLRPTRHAADWLRASRFEQTCALWEAWRADPKWNELWRLRSIRCERTGWRNDPLAARQRVLVHLAECPPRIRLSLPSFVAAMKASDPDFLRPDGDYQSWFIRDAVTGQYLSGFKHWDEIEGRLLVHFVTQPLHWFGVTVLGFARSQAGPSVFAITGRGAMLLGIVPIENIAWTPAPLAIEPNGRVIVPADCSLFARFQLERFAEPEPAPPPLPSPAHRGGGWRYRITPNSVRGAMQDGIGPGKITAFLEQASGQPVPPKLIAAIEAWSSKPSASGSRLSASG